MTPIVTTNLLRLLFIIFCLSMGMILSETLFSVTLYGGMGGAVFGLTMVLIDRLLRGFSLRAFSSATFGLFLGLIASRLLLASNVLKYTDEEIEWAIGVVIYTVFGYLGMMLAMRSNRDEFSLIIPYVRFSRRSVYDVPVVLDTNILIEGRLEALAKTGIISSSVVVPNFVIEELQRLADSSDPLKRERGRRGLDNLSEIRNTSAIECSIHETQPDDTEPVDQKLIHLALILQARLLTNDSNLCKVARLKQVQVVNLNEVSAALRPALAPGQILNIALAKPGKDPHQALGYLEDGTMIVVNNAREFIGESKIIKIAGTLKTAAGRLFFADLVE